MPEFQKLPEARIFRYQGKPIPAIIDMSWGNIYVAGEQFGARLLIMADHFQAAWEIATEHGVIIGAPVEEDDPALNDFEGETLGDRLESALNSGEIDYVDMVGPCWTDHYGWMKQLTGNPD